MSPSAALVDEDPAVSRAGSKPSAVVRSGWYAGAVRHYEDPAYYEHAYRERQADVGFYEDAAKEFGGPILEYGVGSGRIALSIARAGLDITGIDLSAPMLRAFKQRLSSEGQEVADRVTLKRGDMRNVRLKARFPLIIAPFNTVLHLYTRTCMERFLERVRRHLRRGGRFLFDFSVPRPADLGADTERWYGGPRFRHPTSGEVVKYRERFFYDPLHQVLSMWMRFTPKSGKHSYVPLTHRQYFPQEMETLLHYNGFTDIRFRSDFQDELPHAATDTLVVSCRAKSG